MQLACLNAYGATAPNVLCFVNIVLQWLVVRFLNAICGLFQRKAFYLGYFAAQFEKTVRPN
jgi:hypothetical protein